MSEQDLYNELDVEDTEVLDYIREVTADNEAINDLTDDDLQYILDLWYEYLIELDDETDDDDVEVDTDDLYEYITEALADEEADFEISLENLIEILDAEQEFVEDLIYDDEDDEE